MFWDMRSWPNDPVLCREKGYTLRDNASAWSSRIAHCAWLFARIPPFAAHLRSAFKNWAFHYLSRILHRDVLRWNNSLVILFLRLKPPRPQSNHHAVMLSCAILAYTNQNRLTNLPFGLKSFVFPAGTETVMLLALKLVKYLVPFSEINLY